MHMILYNICRHKAKSRSVCIFHRERLVGKKNTFNPRIRNLNSTPDLTPSKIYSDLTMSPTNLERRVRAKTILFLLRDMRPT